MSEVYLGRQICNVVACEGRSERSATRRFHSGEDGWSRAGFEPHNLGSNAFKQASMLLALFGGGDGYRVKRRKVPYPRVVYRPLIATSAWRVYGSTNPLSAADVGDHPRLLRSSSSIPSNDEPGFGPLGLRGMSSVQWMWNQDGSSSCVCPCCPT
ncbi:hypothetical protein HPP92_027703 [Vanilla planifolia]|uniref:Uncharacterized protein n=1 Tax=Vanilla planifolia TaxID=51239 RepID=A0A835PA34_VANPL|nr:hypothetical protein HPP92_027703 [Vanilla planifolia]